MTPYTARNFAIGSPKAREGQLDQFFLQKWHFIYKLSVKKQRTGQKTGKNPQKKVVFPAPPISWLSFSEKGPDLFRISGKGPDLFRTSEKGPDLFRTSEKGPGPFSDISKKGPDLFRISKKGPDLFGISEKGPDLFWNYQDYHFIMSSFDFQGWKLPLRASLLLKLGFCYLVVHY